VTPRWWEWIAIALVCALLFAPFAYAWALEHAAWFQRAERARLRRRHMRRLRRARTVRGVRAERVRRRAELDSLRGPAR
jgi:hypothetical protein